MGVDFIGDRDLTPHLGDGLDQFRPAVSELFRETNPGAGKIANSQGVNSLWRAAQVIAEGDLIVVPKTDRSFHYGLVTGGYEYHHGSPLPHRRRVDWTGSFSREDMSEALSTSVR